MTSSVDLPDSRKHAHGMDCCWPCYEGRPIHPEDDDDPACVERADKTGRCGYRDEWRPA